MASNSEGALHVTGLPEDATEELVTQVFTQYGAVKSATILPKIADKPDAAAIVNMENPDQAKWLIENVSGTVPPGLTAPLSIKEKMNKWSNSSGRGYMPNWAWQQMMQYYGKGSGKGKGGGGWGGLSSFPAEKKVWVGGLPEATDYKQLLEKFPGAKFATVMKGASAGCGGVAYATAEEATEAINTLNGTELGDAVIVVDVWTKKEKPPEDKPAEEVAAA